jgi:hypothetical protein
MRISPKFTSEKLATGSIDDRIDVYEDRVRGWLLHPIHTLLKDRHSHFAALALALTYFEGWAQYRFGEDSRGRSKEFFIRAVREVFPIALQHFPDRPADEIAEEMALLYDEARCGAFHDGITRRNVVVQPTGVPISSTAHPTTLEFSAFVIDPVAFVANIEHHFAGYITVLRDRTNSALRDNFNRTWERKHVGPVLLPPDPY